MNLREHLQANTTMDLWNLDATIEAVKQWALEVIGEDKDIEKERGWLSAEYVQGVNSTKHAIRQRIEESTK